MSEDLTSLVVLNKSQVKPASEVLVRAFYHDPMCVYFYADDLEREKKLPYIFQVILSYCVRYGEVYTTSPALEGVAAWLSSDNHPMTFWKLVHSGMLTAMLKSGGAGTARVRNVADHTETTHKRLAPFKHWYLQMLGVDPQLHGQGYASRLLRPMFSRLDEQRLSCYLDTVVESNIPMYQHFGFRILEKSTVPQTKLTIWVMLRDNQ